LRIVGLLLVALWAYPCHAQTNLRPQETSGWTLTLGAAAVLAPAWQGSKDMAFSVFPDIRVNYGDTIFASVPEGLGWNALNRNVWKAGPIAKLRFGRNEDNGGSPFLVSGGSDALRGLGDIAAAAELGVFVEKRLGITGQWRVRAEVRRGFGGHDGVLADGSIAYQGRLGRTIISVGPRASAASADFMHVYFGTDAVQSLRSELAQYRPGGGLLSYGFGGTLIRPLDQRSTITLFMGVDRLGSAAAHSPLIRLRGQKTQLSVGLGYGFRFSL
jgi:outer membrane protein